MAVIDQSIVVKAPLHDAYTAWLKVLDASGTGRSPVGEPADDDDRDAGGPARADAAIGGPGASGHLRIVEQEADRRITWISTGDTRRDGRVSFASLDEATTRVSLLLDVDAADPDADADTAPDWVRQGVRDTLRRFRDRVEGRGREASVQARRWPHGGSGGRLTSAP